MVRLDKFLAEMGKGTRSEIKKYIKQGRVKVNGAVTKAADVKINPDADQVTFDEEVVSYEEYVYYMLNKPKGVVSATEDSHNKTVIDLILRDDKRRDLFPMGRLDIDTTGLLIISNDGELSHRLLSPKYHVQKCYYAVVEGMVTEDDVMTLKQPLNIGSNSKPELTMPAELEIISSSYDKSEVYLTIKEGKYHQVKRMMARINHPVIELKRVSFGGIRLDEGLYEGEYRRLTDEEVEILISGERCSPLRG